MQARGATLRAAARASRCSQGSRRHGRDPDYPRLAFYREHVPTRDALIVSRIRAAGAITLGKTNTPEFGAGSQTFNTVFGATRNPYDPSKTCGGSSGCRGVARVRHGADRGRKRYGRFASQSRRVLQHRRPPALAQARSEQQRIVVTALGVGADGALGRRRRPLPECDCRSRSSKPALDQRGRSAVSRTARPLFQRRSGCVVARAWWDPVRARNSTPRRREPPGVRDLGCVVEEAEPDFTGIDEAFKVLRYAGNYAQYASRPRAFRVGEGHHQVRSGPGRTAHGGRCRTSAGQAGVGVGGAVSSSSSTECFRAARYAGVALRRYDPISRRLPARRWATISIGCDRAGTSAS